MLSSPRQPQLRELYCGFSFYMNERGVPDSIGIILDGNRRWAKARGLPTLEGHRQGLETLKAIARHAQARGVRHLAVYAFSTENWNRTAEEVSYLLQLFAEAAGSHAQELGKEGMRLRFVGQRERFREKLQTAMRDLEEATRENEGLTLWLCLSYGGRAEIVTAAREVARRGEEITEESLAKNLWTAELPDTDLIIRTGGEKRLSNFLTWRSVYSELFFVATYWPDFGTDEFDAILSEFAVRERRHGK